MKPAKLFVYGILKRGYSLDLGQFPETSFTGEAFLQGAQLHAIGSGVGLRFVLDPLEVAHGEVWAIPDSMWDYLDEIESNGRVYTRKIVDVKQEFATGPDYGGETHTVKVWVYAHTMLATQAEYDKHYPKIEDGRYVGYEKTQI